MYLSEREPTHQQGERQRQTPRGARRPMQGLRTPASGPEPKSHPGAGNLRIPCVSEVWRGRLPLPVPAETRCPRTIPVQSLRCQTSPLSNTQSCGCLESSGREAASGDSRPLHLLCGSRGGQSLRGPRKPNPNTFPERTQPRTAGST